MRKNQTFCLESPLFRGERKTKLYACAYIARVRAHMRVRVHNIYGRMLKIDAQYLVPYLFFAITRTVFRNGFDYSVSEFLQQKTLPFRQGSRFHNIFCAYKSNE